MTESSISRYVNNERTPRTGTAIKICNVLNVSLEWLSTVTARDANANRITLVLIVNTEGRDNNEDFKKRLRY